VPLGDIFTVANAGDDEETGNLLLDGADGALDDAVFILVPGGLCLATPNGITSPMPSD